MWCWFLLHKRQGPHFYRPRRPAATVPFHVEATYRQYLKCGVLAPNAKLRQAVIASAGPSGATLQVLQEAEQKMGLQEEQPEPRAGERYRKTAARCWALLLARVYECLPLQCPRCGQPMRIIAFILEPPVVERMWNRYAIPPSASGARGGADNGVGGAAGAGTAPGGVRVRPGGGHAGMAMAGDGSDGRSG